MSSTSPEARSRPARSSRITRDPTIRVVVTLSDRDEGLISFLRLEGFQVDNAVHDALETTASARAAEAMILDADLPGTLAAVTRVRKSEGVVSTIPIVLIGAPGVSLRTSLDAVDAGGDVFVPRPFSQEDLVQRLRSLLELPGSPEPGSVSTPPQPYVSRPPSQQPPDIAPNAPKTDRSGGGGVGLSPALAEVLRVAAVRAGGNEAELILPSLDDDAIDELIPAELLEPLDAPLDTLSDDALMGGPQHTPPPYAPGSSPPSRRSSNRSMLAVAPRSGPPTPTITPLAVGGEMRLGGTIGSHGAGAILGAAWRSRASGLVMMRARGAEFSLSLMSGHLLAIRSNRPEHETGPLLARLGAIPREAERFAATSLDTGVRGAALLAARGYLTADALGHALARAAREITFDLLALGELEWEMRPLDTANEIPLTPRSIDALLVLGARARIEPIDAVKTLGGTDVIVVLKSDPATLATLPLTRTERDAASSASARNVTLRAILDSFGPDVAPALVALAWLGALRVEGAKAGSLMQPAAGATLALERTRVRSLIEAAAARDYFALLGVSEWSTHSASLDALEARRTELAGLRARHPDVESLLSVHAALDELATLLADRDSWERYALALRARTS